MSGYSQGESRVIPLRSPEWRQLQVDRLQRMAKLRAAMVLLEPGIPAELNALLPQAHLACLEDWAARRAPAAEEAYGASLFWAHFMALRQAMRELEP